MRLIHNECAPLRWPACQIGPMPSEWRATMHPQVSHWEIARNFRHVRERKGRSCEGDAERSAELRLSSNMAAYGCEDFREPAMRLSSPPQSRTSEQNRRSATVGSASMCGAAQPIWPEKLRYQCGARSNDEIRVCRWRRCFLCREAFHAISVDRVERLAARNCEAFA